MIDEAPLVDDGTGLAPAGPGWFVLNARDSRWGESAELGAYTNFEGPDRFEGLGINLNVLMPGQPACMYHGEGAQEDFLMLAGEAILIVEGVERPLRAWDLVHCPPWTEHVIVGAGTGPCLFVAVGARPGSDDLRYPDEPAAAAHGAAALETTSDPAEAYARFAPSTRRRYRDGDLPGL